jgi:BirA family biotin operon repressor/biotin-[acetyl-CoA-carboxylase] ligase
MNVPGDSDPAADPDRYDEPTIRRALTTKWIGRPLTFSPEVSSTNELLREAAAAGALGGAVAVAEYQTAGRGRQGRRWEARPGTSILASVLLRQELPVERAPWLVMAAGLAAARAIALSTALDIGLKWPNDLLAERGGEWRKVGGILMEIETKDGRLAWAIVGSGINVNMTRDQLPTDAAGATSLLIALGRPVARAPLLAAYLAALEAYSERLTAGWSPLQEWKRLLVTLGREVVVFDPDGRELFSGTAEDVDDWGRLVVRDKGGWRRVVAAGDVSLRH